MKERTSSKKNMVYTPECHIPIGEAVTTEKGELALRIKKNSREYEVVPIGMLVTQVARTAGPPFEEAARLTNKIRSRRAGPKY